MFDHVSLDVRDQPASRAFYERALRPLGWEVIAEWPGGCGLGKGRGGPTLWLKQDGTASGPVHLAFRAADRASVEAFFAGAKEAGGRDNGAPGLRDYHEHYYGAFVLDPDGNNVEAVCHAAPQDAPPSADEEEKEEE